MHRISLSHFDDFLEIARQQAEPQRLLIILAKRELPEHHSLAQAKQFEDGVGGYLAPLVAVDKQPDEIARFHEFKEESEQIVGDWDAMFVGALVGMGQLPTQEETDKAIEKMLNAVREGKISAYLTFNNQGLPLSLSEG